VQLGPVVSAIFPKIALKLVWSLSNRMTRFSFAEICH